MYQTNCFRFDSEVSNNLIVKRSHLQSISIAGARLEDAQPLQLSAQQSQHSTVDVIEADARRAQRQAGVLDLQNSFVQLRLDRIESARKASKWNGMLL